MKGKRFCILPLLLQGTALLLMCLPTGVPMRFLGEPDGEPVQYTFSYFSMIPWGYGNLAAPATWMLTVAALLLLLVRVLRRKDARRWNAAGKVVSTAAAVASLLIFVLPMTGTVTGLFVSLLLSAAAGLLFWGDRRCAPVTP